MKLRKRWGLLVYVCVIGVLLVSCSQPASKLEETETMEESESESVNPTAETSEVSQEEESLQRAEEQVLRVGHAYSWRWDPATAGGTDLQIGMNTFFATLMEVNPEGEMVPFAAESVDVSEDGLTYTYTLREGLQFGPTGTPVTAEDVKWSWERNLKAGGVAFDILKNVKGFNDYMDEEADEVEGLVVVDERTFRVEFETFDSLWWERQGASALMILERAQIEQGAPERHWCENGCGGVGRYVVEQINMDEQWAWLVKNPHYFGDDNNGPDRIYATRVGDEQTRLLMYESGELDIIFVSGGILRTINDPEHPLYEELTRVDAQGFSNLIMRADREPFTDPKFREAVYYAIDYQGILNNVYGGAYPVMNANAGPKGPYGEIIKDWPLMAQDIERAQQAFQDSSYNGDPDSVPTIRLYSSSSADVRLFVQAIQENLRDVLGVNVELTISDNPLRPEQQETEQFQAWSHAPLTYEPGEELYALWACDGGWNQDWAHWCDERMTEIMKEANQTVDQDARLELYAQADQILLDAHVNILQWWQTNYYLQKPYVQDVVFGDKSPMIFNWQKVWISEQ